MRTLPMWPVAPVTRNIDSLSRGGRRDCGHGLVHISLHDSQEQHHAVLGNLAPVSALWVE
jgi:hypothetical protein